MVRVINATFTASASVAAQSNAEELLCELAEAACRRNVATEHPGFAALALRQLGLYCTPSIYQPDRVEVIAMYGYTLIRAPLCA
jgi:hypothetical protein